MIPVERCPPSSRMPIWLIAGNRIVGERHPGLAVPKDVVIGLTAPKESRFEGTDEDGFICGVAFAPAGSRSLWRPCSVLGVAIWCADGLILQTGASCRSSRRSRRVARNLCQAQLFLTIVVGAGQKIRKGDFRDVRSLGMKCSKLVRGSCTDFRKGADRKSEIEDPCNLDRFTSGDAVLRAAPYHSLSCRRANLPRAADTRSRPIVIEVTCGLERALGRLSVRTRSMNAELSLHVATFQPGIRRPPRLGRSR